MMAPIEFSTPLIGASVDPGDIYNALSAPGATRGRAASRSASRVSSRNSNVFAPPRKHPSSRKRKGATLHLSEHERVADDGVAKSVELPPAWPRHRDTIR
jgi:hypothetical protein